MKNFVLLPSLLVVAGCFVGCAPYGSIRVVKTSKAGGEMALFGQRDLARQQAEGEMARTCGAGNFEVLEEGEAVVGQIEQSSGSTSTQKGRTLFGVPATSTSGSSTTETTQKTEWRLKYACKGAEGAKQGSATIHEVVVTF